MMPCLILYAAMCRQNSDGREKRIRYGQMCEQRLRALLNAWVHPGRCTHIQNYTNPAGPNMHSHRQGGEKYAKQGITHLALNTQHTCTGTLPWLLQRRGPEQKDWPFLDYTLPSPISTKVFRLRHPPLPQTFGTLSSTAYTA